MLIEIANLTKVIRKRTILEDVSLTILPGRITALVGPNGSGKTMLMRAVAGLISPTAGHVSVDGKHIGRDLDFPPSMGMLLESPAFLDAYTGLQNLSTLASIRKVTSEEQVRAWITAVGLDPADRRRYRAYSLGMKQRLGIAAALMEEPELLLLDEPTNALDVDGVALVSTLIAQARDRGATVVLACHDERVIEKLADDIWYLAEGHIDNRRPAA